MTQALLNISDFNNKWNRSVLDKAWKEREARWKGPERSSEQSSKLATPSAEEPVRDESPDKKD
jgi:hypothetical protein